MNTDFRIEIGFFSHPKTQKLRRRLKAEGESALVRLWSHTAQYRPRGVLTGMDTEDIALAAAWQGDADEFVRTLEELRFLDRDGSAWSVHDWKDHNAYAYAAPDRSEKSRRAAEAKRNKRSQDRERAVPDRGPSIAPAPAPDISVPAGAATVEVTVIVEVTVVLAEVTTNSVPLQVHVSVEVVSARIPTCITVATSAMLTTAGV